MRCRKRLRESTVPRAKRPLMPFPRELARQRTSEASDDLVAAVHSAADCNFSVDDRAAFRWPRCLQAVAYLSFAAGRLPDDPDRHVLSRSESGRRGIEHYRAFGTPVWTASRA